MKTLAKLSLVAFVLAVLVFVVWQLAGQRVRGVDALSREPLAKARVTYGMVFTGERATSYFNARPAATRGEWEVVVEPGLIDIDASADGYASERRSWFVSTAGQELTFELYRTANLPLTLTLKIGDTECPIPLDEWVKIAVESGPAGGRKTLQEFRATGLSFRSSISVIRISQPGLYVLRVPKSICGGESDQLVTVEVKDPDGASVVLQRVE